MNDIKEVNINEAEDLMDQGWELVTAVAASGWGGRIIYILKRQGDDGRSNSKLG